MTITIATYSRDDQGLINYCGIESSWPSLDDLAAATHGPKWQKYNAQEFGALAGWQDNYVLWIGNLGVALDNHKWRFKGYTIGLECWIKTPGGEKLALVKVEIEENDLGCLRLSAVSGRNGGQIASCSKALITPAQRDAAPHKTANDVGYAIWALNALGLSPAAIDNDDI